MVRPRKRKDPLEKFLRVRVTAAEKERFEKAAAADGKPLSDWVRDLCEKAAKRPAKK